MAGNGTKDLKLERILTTISMWGDSHVQVSLTWTNLVVRSKQDPSKVLLDNVSGCLGTGFTAIMGPSGAGKSTLLNALALRLSSVTTEGRRQINGDAYTQADLKRIGGYVLQEDILSPTLTVEETLAYAARLRLPADWTPERRAARVDEVIDDMGLAGSRHTVIGSAMVKGISGGQRKRVSVGLELLHSPRIIFLDEPTSGLDSSTAYSLCSLLRHLSTAKNATIVATLHQPSQKICELFNGMMLLAGGAIVYSGTFSAAIDYFGARGFPLPALTNPADWYMEVLTYPGNTERLSAEARPSKAAVEDSVGALGKEVEAAAVEVDGDADDEVRGARIVSSNIADANRARTSWFVQFWTLLRRATLETARQWRTIVVQLCVSIFMGLLLGGYAYNPGDVLPNALTVRTRVLFFALITQGVFGATGVIQTFPSERTLYLKERAAGLYKTSPYYLATAIVATVKFIMGPIFFSPCAYFLNGLQPTASKFFIYTGFMVLCQVSTTALALMVAALSRTAAVAVVVLPLCLEASRLCSGFFTTPAKQTAGWQWIEQLSYVTYSYAAVLQNEFSGLTLTCTEANLNASNGLCKDADPYQSYVVANGYDTLTIGENAACMVAYTVICHTIAYLGVRYLKK